MNEGLLGVSLIRCLFCWVALLTKRLGFWATLERNMLVEPHTSSSTNHDKKSAATLTVVMTREMAGTTLRCRGIWYAV